MAYDPNHGHEEHVTAAHRMRALPADLNAPAVVKQWRLRALLIAALFFVLSLAFLPTAGGWDHIVRAYLLGYMTIFGFAGGGLCVLMLQYVTGGKWGLLLRRPLEAMANTTPLLLLMTIPLLIPGIGGRLWLWAKFPSVESVKQGVAHGLLTETQAHMLTWKHPMLSPGSVAAQFLLVFSFMLLWNHFLQRWSLQRDADPERGTIKSYEFWRIKAENLSGIGILLYVGLLTLVAIDFVMSLDISWYSTMYGLTFLVAQGYAVLALGVHTVVRLNTVEPMKTMVRKVEMYDLGKFMLGFVMLNIYLTFAQFLIIWSANSPEEIPWYLNRIHGGWWVICSLDFFFHWVIPFCCLLSRDFKKSRSKMLALTAWMIFARCFDAFWLIEPNFSNAMGNLHLSGNISLFAYITVPIAVIALWMAYYLTQLASRPLIVVNDPHTAEILEPEHAH